MLTEKHTGRIGKLREEEKHRETFLSGVAEGVHRFRIIVFGLRILVAVHAVKQIVTQHPNIDCTNIHY